MSRTFILQIGKSEEHSPVTNSTKKTCDLPRNISILTYISMRDGDYESDIVENT